MLRWICFLFLSCNPIHHWVATKNNYIDNDNIELIIVEVIEVSGHLVQFSGRLAQFNGRLAQFSGRLSQLSDRNGPGSIPAVDDIWIKPPVSVWPVVTKYLRDFWPVSLTSSSTMFVCNIMWSQPVVWSE